MNRRTFTSTGCILILTLGLVILAIAPLWSQEQEQKPDFVAELLELLAEEGWSAAQVQALATQNVDWERADGADPEVVALALEFAVSEDEAMGPMEQALLAITVAEAAIEMEAIGIGEMTIALTALEGVRDILAEVKAFRESEGEMTGQQLAEHIRHRIGEQVVETAARERVEERIQERIRAAKANHPEDFVPDIPGEGEYPGPGGWPF